MTYIFRRFNRRLK